MSEKIAQNKEEKSGFKKLISKNFHFIVISLTFIICIIIVLLTFSANFFPINNETPQNLSKGWKYSVDGGEYRDIDFPNDIKEKVNDKVTLIGILPSELVKGATLLIRTSQQTVEVYVGGELIYTTQKENGKDIPSSAYHFVRLPVDAFNAEIKIELKSPYSRYDGILNEILLGSKASLIFNLFSKNGLMFLIGFILFLVGLFMTIASIIIKFNQKESGMTYLGGFFMAAGVWVLAESKLLQFIVPFPNLITNLSIFALTLLPLFCCLYYLETHVKAYRKPLLILTGLVAAGGFSMLFISIFNIMFPILSFTYYLIFMGLSVLALLAIIFMEYVKNRKSLSVSVFGILLFSLLAVIELILYFINIKNYSNSFFITIGLFCFCIILFYELIHNSKKAYETALSVGALKKLAYTDSLTGLSNRTAFIEELSSVAVSDARTGVAMIDINNLKSINDNEGHLRGDYAIIACANILKKVMKPNSVFRIGGDEFVVIVKETPGKKLETYLNRWELLQEEMNKCQDCKIDFAYGYAIYSAGEDRNLFATVERADKEMYKCKMQQKAKHNN